MESVRRRLPKDPKTPGDDDPPSSPDNRTGPAQDRRQSHHHQRHQAPAYTYCEHVS